MLVVIGIMFIRAKTIELGSSVTLAAFMPPVSMVVALLATYIAAVRSMELSSWGPLCNFDVSLRRLVTCELARAKCRRIAVQD